jgi:phosphoribosylformylglycinamidine synthase
MTEDPKRWSQPVAALLGAYRAQMKLGLGSIGGKDSMSGTFEDIDVPPTLVSFAVDVSEGKNIISPEFKKPGNRVYLINLSQDEFSQPDFEADLRIFSKVNALQKKKEIVSAYTVESHGAIEAVFKMGFGNGLGFIADANLNMRDLFKPAIGALVVEVKSGSDACMKEFDSVLLGTVTTDVFTIKNMTMRVYDAIDLWEGKLENVFPTGVDLYSEPIETKLYNEPNVYVCKHKVAKPKVFIPVFPGTNCEFDSAKVFEQAGATTETIVFRDLSENDIRESVEAFRKAISESQIVMFPGGFSGGDETAGSAEFFATAFRNDVLKEEMTKLLNE